MLQLDIENKNTVITFTMLSLNRLLPLLLCFILSSIVCGSEINNTLKSPGYPDNYPNYTECQYHVPIPRNMTMNMTFVDFEVEDHSNCM